MYKIIWHTWVDPDSWKDKADVKGFTKSFDYPEHMLQRTFKSQIFHGKTISKLLTICV